MGHLVARYIHSLAPLNPLTRSAALCFATLASLCYACFARLLRSWARSLTSLTPLWDSWNFWICVQAESAFSGNARIWLSQETRPKSLWIHESVVKTLKGGMDCPTNRPTHKPIMRLIKSWGFLSVQKIIFLHCTSSSVSFAALATSLPIHRYAHWYDSWYSHTSDFFPLRSSYLDC